MTNKEKYKEIFGFEPDTDNCPTIYCSNCPCHTDGSYYCNGEWWEEEYKGGAL